LRKATLKHQNSNAKSRSLRKGKFPESQFATYGIRSGTRATRKVLKSWRNAYFSWPRTLFRPLSSLRPAAAGFPGSGWPFSAGKSGNSQVTLASGREQEGVIDRITCFWVAALPPEVSACAKEAASSPRSSHRHRPTRKARKQEEHNNFDVVLACRGRLTLPFRPQTLH